MCLQVATIIDAFVFLIIDGFMRMCSKIATVGCSLLHLVPSIKIFYVNGDSVRQCICASTSVLAK